MIRCENCGHKLKDGQKVCDICKKPVYRQDTEDFELEEQLAKSIAQIVENETADAEVYLRQIQGTLDKNGQRTRAPQRSTDSRERTADARNSVRNTGSQSSVRTMDTVKRNNDGKDVLGVSQRSSSSRQSSSGNVSNKPAGSQRSRKKSGRGGKIAVIVITSILVVFLLVGLAFYTINKVISKAQDNFAYYNNIGIEYVQKGDYASAIPYLEKALTYEESQGKVNLRFSLYDCYVATNDTENAISMLYNILNIDKYNLEAIVNLEAYYENAGVTEALVDMYNKYKDTPAADAVAKYFVEAPEISVESGEYTSDLEVLITSDYNFDIYYTLDGSDPDMNSTLYTGPVTIAEGDTTLKCITVNVHKIMSDVVSAEYSITYTAPDGATISPKSGSYETEQLIVIGNIPRGGKAYYTLDNTTPNKYSTLYEGPFDMPSGNTVLSVIIYDKNGLASKVVKRNYVLNKEDKYSQSYALERLWDTMQEKSMVDENHLSSDGQPVNLVFDSKMLIDGHPIWVFSIYVSTEQGDMKANYQMGVDADTAVVYTVYENNGIYRLDEVLY